MSDCQYDYTIGTDITEGQRNFTILHLPDCTVVLEELRDLGVVEPGEFNVAQVSPGIFAPMRHVVGKLMDALFPTAFAQTWVYKTAYHDIWTCGAICPPDGLTAQQGWIDYRYILNSEIRLDSALGWFCTAGLQYRDDQWKSFCLEPMDIPGSPMQQYDTGWRGYNPFIVERYWGTPNSSFVKSYEKTNFFWCPENNPCPQYEHILYNQRTAWPSGNYNCSSTTSGTFVRGPMRSFVGCAVKNRTP